LVFIIWRLALGVVKQNYKPQTTNERSDQTPR